MKKRSYETRICEVEHGSFTPLIFSPTGGMANKAYTFYKHLASLLLVKWDEHYAAVMGWIRCCLSLSLLHFSIWCLRASWSSIGSFGCFVLATSVELVQAETGLSSCND